MIGIKIIKMNTGNKIRSFTKYTLKYPNTFKLVFWISCKKTEKLEIKNYKIHKQKVFNQKVILENLETKTRMQETKYKKGPIICGFTNFSDFRKVIKFIIFFKN